MEELYDLSDLFRAKFRFVDLLDEFYIENENIETDIEIIENRTFIPSKTQVIDISQETVEEYADFMMNNSFGAFRLKSYYDYHLKKYDQTKVMPNLQRSARLVEMMGRYNDLQFRYEPPSEDEESNKRFKKYHKVHDENLVRFKHNLVQTQRMGPKIITGKDLVARIKDLEGIVKELDFLLELEDDIAVSAEGFYIPERVKFIYDSFKLVKDPKNTVELVEISSEDFPKHLETFAKQISEAEKSNKASNRSKWRNAKKSERYAEKRSNWKDNGWNSRWTNSRHNARWNDSRQNARRSSRTNYDSASAETWRKTGQNESPKTHSGFFRNWRAHKVVPNRGNNAIKNDSNICANKFTNSERMTYSKVVSSSVATNTNNILADNRKLNNNSEVMTYDRERRTYSKVMSSGSRNRNDSNATNLVSNSSRTYSKSMAYDRYTRSNQSRNNRSSNYIENRNGFGHWNKRTNNGLQEFDINQKVAGEKTPRRNCWTNKNYRHEEF